MQPPVPPRSRDRVARLRLPELPPRDLERLAAVGVGPHSAPALSTGPDSAGYLPPPSATPTKFGGEGSPADVRGYAVTPLLMRGGVVSPGVGGGSGLVLPTLSLPLTSSALPPASQLTSSQQHLTTTTTTTTTTQPVSTSSPSQIHHSSTNLIPSPPLQPQSSPTPPPQQLHNTNTTTTNSNNMIISSSSSSLSNPHQQQSIYNISSAANNCKSPPPPPTNHHHVTSTTSNINRTSSGARTTPSSPVGACGLTQNEIKKAQNRKSAKRFREAQKQRWKNMADDLMSHKRTIDELRAQLSAQANAVAHANNALRAAQQMQQQQQQQQLQNSNSNCLLTS